MNYPQQSMASVQSIEASVMTLLGQRGTCTQALPEDFIRRIHAVRILCKAAEETDGNGQLQWRRGGGGPSGHAPKSSKWRGGSGGGNGGGQSDKPKPAHNVGKYVSKFTNSETPVEDKILNQIIMNKLNKFSLTNYSEVKDFLEQILDNNETEFLHNFIQLVFKKASNEPTFCPLYAKLVSELSAKYGFFKKELYDIYSKYIEIFEDVPEEKSKSYEQYVQQNRDKLQRHGYSRFLGELTSMGVLELEQLKGLYIKLINQLKVAAAKGDEKQQLVEEFVDCLVCMTRAFQKETEALLHIRKQLGEACDPLLEDILSNRTSLYPGLSKKGSFAIMDCLDIFRGAA
jgi:hypothetical protein